MDSKTQIEFPDCWEEVKPEEWQCLLRLCDHLKKRKGMSLTDVKRAWCNQVLRNRGCQGKGTEFLLLVDRLAGTLDWMWHVDETNRQVELTYDTTQNLMPEWRKLRGPVDHGADLTFGEFRHATAVMNRYTREHNPADLHALCSILYRPTEVREGVTVRVPFREQRMGVYMAHTRMMPEWLQWGIYNWFAYFCEYLFTGVFIIDGMEVCFAPVFRRTSGEGDAAPSDVQSLGMTSVLYSVAESGVFGTAAETDDTPLLRVLMKLLDDKQRADELLKTLKKR